MRPSSAAQTSPLTVSMDKIGDAVFVFVFARVDAQQLDTAMERPRPASSPPIPTASARGGSYITRRSPPFSLLSSQSTRTPKP
jgi:hypothetical protein